MKKSQIRAGWELDSAKLGVLLVGDEVVVIGARQIEGGTVRCQLQGDMGWVSLATASGVIIARFDVRRCVLVMRLHLPPSFWCLRKDLGKFERLTS